MVRPRIFLALFGRKIEPGAAPRKGGAWLKGPDKGGGVGRFGRPRSVGCIMAGNVRRRRPVLAVRSRFGAAGVLSRLGVASGRAKNRSLLSGIFQRSSRKYFSGWRRPVACLDAFAWLAVARPVLVCLCSGLAGAGLGGRACACSRSTTGQARKLCVLCGVFRRLIAARGFCRSTFSFSEKRSKNSLLSLGRVVYL